MTIYVAHLPEDVTEDAVRELFSAHGDVLEVTLIYDRDTGKPRGFGFVVMAPEQALSAIEALDGTPFGDETLKINEARDRGAKAPRRPW